MRVGFLFNHYAPHQVPHAVPYAFELSRQCPELEVIIACSTKQEKEVVQAISALYPRHRCAFKTLKTAWYHRAIDPLVSRRAFKRKKWVLQQNLDFFHSLDALVAPERNCLKLRSVYGLHHLKMIHTRHGAGDAAGAFDERCKAFDFVLLPGQKYVDRLDACGYLRPDAYAVPGCPKFETLPALQNEKRRFFDNDNPIVVYNPHFDQHISSWQTMGLSVLDFFADNTDYNLIFAPHVVLFKRAKRHNASLPGCYARRPNILVDIGSKASSDMTYLTAADIYLGDVSSQVYEFLIRPRPCIFLNAHNVAWENDLHYFGWTLGQVVNDVETELRPALAAAASRQTMFDSRQKAAFNYTFYTEPGSTVAERGARAIADFLFNHHASAALST